MNTRILSVLWIATLIGCANSGGPNVPHEASTPSAAVATTAPAAQPSAPASVASALPVTRETDTVPTSHGDLRITPIHHATLLFQVAGAAIYLDPVHDASYEGLPKADAIFLTDIHPDHLDMAGIDAVLDPSKTVIIAPQAVADKLPKTLAQVTVMKNGEVSTSKSAIVPSLGPWLGVEAVPMYNLKRGPKPGQLYHDKGRGNGYVFVFGDKRVYVSGDTECTPEMRALKNIDIAFVCMNLPYTMPPSEAAACIKAFRPKIVYPFHYRGSDLGELQTALAGEPGIELRLRKWY